MDTRTVGSAKEIIVSKLVPDVILISLHIANERMVSILDSLSDIPVSFKIYYKRSIVSKIVIST